MKLSQLAIAERTSEDRAIHALLGHVPAVVRHNNDSVYYHFVDVVLQNNILSEAGQSGLQSILQAGVARLKSALMPRASADLDALLSFMAPDRGGSKAIAGLIDSAKSTNGPLSQNDDWWDNLFATLNITDTKTCDDIRQRSSVESGQQYQGINQNSAASSRDKVRSAMGQNSYADDLRKEREASGQHADQISGMLDKARSAREASGKRLGDLNSRLDSLMSRMPRTEAVFAPAVSALLENATVRVNLRPIVNQTLARIYANPPVISEAGLLDRARTFAANPNFAKNEVSRFTSSQDNVRVAKLAIQLATEHLRDQFSAALSNAGLSPEEILKIYQQWAKLRTSGGDPGQIQALQSKLQQAYTLFTTKKGGGQSDMGQSDADQIAGSATPVTAALGAGQAPAPYQQKPINTGPQPQPTPGTDMTVDRKPFARDLARKMVIAASAAAERGQDPLQAAKYVAQRAARVDPQTANVVWRMFKSRYRTGQF